MATVSYTDLINKGGTIYTKAGKGYSSPEQLAADLGISSTQIDWSKIAKETANPYAQVQSTTAPYSVASSNTANQITSPYVSAVPSIPQTPVVSQPVKQVDYSPYTDVGGTIYKDYGKPTQKAYQTEAQLYSDLGTNVVDWTQIKKQSATPSQTQPVSQPATQPASVINGQLYREAGTNEVYYINSQGQKMHITDPDTLTSEFGAAGWSNVKVVPSGTLSTVAQGGELTKGYLAGTQLKTGSTQINPTTGKKEVYNAETKTWSPAETFTAGETGNVIDTSKATSTTSLPASVKSQIAEGSLIRATGTPEVYAVENGKARWIENEKAFTDAGYDWNKVVEVTPTLLNEFTKGASINDIVAKFKTDTSYLTTLMKEAADTSGYSDAQKAVADSNKAVITKLTEISDWIKNQPTTSDEMKSAKDKLTEVDTKLNDLTANINKLSVMSENRPGATKAFVTNEQSAIQKFYQLDLLALQGQRAIYQNNYDEAKLNFKSYLDNVYKSKQLDLDALQLAVTNASAGLSIAQQDKITLLNAAISAEKSRLETAQNDVNNKANIYTTILSKYGNIPGLYEAFTNPDISSIELATLVAPYEAADYAASKEASNWISVENGVYNKYTGEFKPNPYATGTGASADQTLNTEIAKVKAAAEAWKNSIYNPELIKSGDNLIINTSSIDRTSKTGLVNNIIATSNLKYLTPDQVSELVNDTVGSAYENPVISNPAGLTADMSQKDYLTWVDDTLSPEEKTTPFYKTWYENIKTFLTPTSSKTTEKPTTEKTEQSTSVNNYWENLNSQISSFISGNK